MGLDIGPFYTGLVEGNYCSLAPKLTLPPGEGLSCSYMSWAAEL